jgi:hypothetical protein
LSTCGAVVIVLMNLFSEMIAIRNVAGVGRDSRDVGQTFRVYEGSWGGSKAREDSLSS